MYQQSKFSKFLKSKKTKIVTIAIILIALTVFMDISRILVHAEPTDKYTFFYDSFADRSTFNC